MTFNVEVTGKRLDGSEYLLAVKAVAQTADEAKDMVERDYDWENALSMNFNVQPA
jgi:hypothetical protein